tara:strand:- start:4263 stop:4478 length:216 start_codon:yes stop_codon:yes gene_type:complete
MYINTPVEDFKMFRDGIYSVYNQKETKRGMAFIGINGSGFIDIRIDHGKTLHRLFNMFDADSALDFFNKLK